jgi:hypothetical protein
MKQIAKICQISKMIFFQITKFVWWVPIGRQKYIMILRFNFSFFHTWFIAIFC